MKRFIFTAISLATVLSFSACDPQRRVRRNQSASGPQPEEEAKPKTKVASRDRDRDDSSSDRPSVEKKSRTEVTDPPPVKHNVPPPPEPKSNNPEYAPKADGKPGYVKSPYDPQGRLIDVRGLPPGTEAECPYTRRTFLVPP